MKKLLLLLTIIIISLAASCHKEEETPNLHETVRFKLNGVEWKAYDYTEGAISSWGTGAGLLSSGCQHLICSPLAGIQGWIY